MGIRVNLARWQNRLELFNEWICGSILIYSCLFTDVNTAEMRFVYGWHVVILTSIGLGVNAVYILMSLIDTVKLYYLKCIRQSRHDKKMAGTSVQFQKAIAQMKDEDTREILKDLVRKDKRVVEME